MAKRKGNSRKVEYVDVFALAQMAFNDRREKEAQERLAAMSADERQEYRGAAMAAGSFLRCLGPPAEEFAGNDYFQRVHEAFQCCVETTAPANGPRPIRIVVSPWNVFRERLVKRKYFTSVCNADLRLVYRRAKGTVSLSSVIGNSPSTFTGSRLATHAQICIGVGLFSDMVYSSESDQYHYLHPELEGTYFSCDGPRRPLQCISLLDLSVPLPLDGDLPEGLYLVGSVIVRFWGTINGELELVGGGGMKAEYVEIKD